MHRHLLASYDFPPVGGGIARLTGELAKRYPAGTLLVSTGRVAGGATADAELPNRVDRVGIESTRLRTVQGLLVWSHRLRRLAQAFDPAFLWCGNLKPAAFPALWVRRREGIPYGIMLYGTELLLLQQRIRRMPRKRVAARMALRDAAVLVTVSDWTRRLCLEVLAELGLGAGEIEVRTIPLGTDPLHFRPGVDTRAVRARYGLDDGCWLLTVARLAAHKGIDTGLRVLAALREARPDLRYAIVGTGIKQPELEALAHELGVADRVRFLTAVPDADLPALYNCAEIYLGLSRPVELLIEGFGIALTEASASGIPVIGGLAGGIPDAVRDGETGLLVDSTDLLAVIASVRSLLADQDLGRRLGQAGRRAVESYFNWERVTADVQRTGAEFGVRRSPRA
ncbi:MAG: glycosyltransferase family 4 protein [Gemmatimonadota bacterium]|nr:glycosyltransferase family 4 protein [Gemmatimonadota bacterium]